MARPRSFDPDAALDAAMRVFWAQGFDATSIDDIVRATGVNRSSLYALWGDKRGLFVASLDRYGESVGGFWLRLLGDGPSPLAAIRRYVTLLASAICDDPDRLGCFAVNSAVEVGSDPAIAPAIRANFDLVEEGYRAALLRARDLGELPPDADINAHAAHLAVTTQALLLQARTGAPRATILAAARIALSTLPFPEVP